MNIDELGIVPHEPLTKKEYFAAMAMQGFVLHYSKYTECNFETCPKETAKRAVEYADALIEELKKEEENEQNNF